MAYIKNKLTEEDYFNYVINLKYSEAIELLTLIGEEKNIDINKADGFIKGMCIYAGIIQRMNNTLLESGLQLKIK